MAYTNTNTDIPTEQNTGSTLNSVRPTDYEISTTSVKLPQFWTTCPQAWFVTAEAQFSAKKISSDTTKYDYTLMALPEEVVTTVLDIVQNPTIFNKYEHLKSALIGRFSLSEKAKLDKILGDSEIGDQKPSEFYRTLILLAGNNFDSSLLKNIWLRKLPKTLNIALMAANTNDIPQLLKLADDIWETMQGTEIASVNHPTHHTPLNIHTNNTTQVDRLEKMVDKLVHAMSNVTENLNKLTLDIAEIKAHTLIQNRYRSFNRPRSRGRSPRVQNGFCEYHTRFGINARNCRPPCNFKANTNSTN